MATQERSDKLEDINRILVVSRSTKYCQKAVHYAVSLARRYEAEIVILHVVHDPIFMDGWNLPIAFLPELKKEYRKMFDTAKKDLDRIIRKEKAAGLPIKELIVEGNPTEKVFETVKEEKIDLIVMVAYEQSLVEHWLFGRETDEIVRRMPCSVLLVRKKIGE